MQKYTEAESRTNKFVLPRRRQYFCRRQIYAEAESNANEFALACFEQRSREASGSRIRRAKQACKPGGLHCRGVNRISARQGKYRRSREGHGVPRKKRTGVRFVPGKSATVSRHIDPLSPEGRARDAGRMAYNADDPVCTGESATILRHISSLPPPQRRQMYACRISMTEDTVLCFMLPV